MQVLCHICEFAIPFTLYSDHSSLCLSIHSLLNQIKDLKSQSNSINLKLLEKHDKITHILSSSDLESSAKSYLEKLDSLINLDSCPSEVSFLPDFALFTTSIDPEWPTSTDLELALSEIGTGVYVLKKQLVDLKDRKESLQRDYDLLNLEYQEIIEKGMSLKALAF